MKDLSKLLRMSYAEALLCSEARNCGLYFIFEGEQLLYVGKASSITLKRRLAEHVTYDNQFNTLTKKIADYLKLPLVNTEVIFEFIVKELKFALISYQVHGYKGESDYYFDHLTKEEIQKEEKELIIYYKPPLNNRKKMKLIK